MQRLSNKTYMYHIYLIAFLFVLFSCSSNPTRGQLISPEYIIKSAVPIQGEKLLAEYINGLQKDTVYIGYIKTSLLIASGQAYNQLYDKYTCDENEGKMCYSNIKHWIKKLQKEDEVDVYWVKN